MNFCHVGAIEGIITDSGVAPEIVEQFAQMGTKIIVAE